MFKILIGLLFIANSYSATLLLSGEVPSILSLEVFPSGNETLDLSVSQTDLTVASVNEKSNSSTGYKILISSLNSGVLENGVVDSITYTLKYDGNPVTLSSTAVIAKTAVTGLYNHDSSVDISYTIPVNGNQQGIYTDTITFTIQSN